MDEIEIAGNTYKIGKLNAKEQFRIAKRLSPVMLSLGLVGSSQESNTLVRFQPLINAVAEMSDADSEFVIDLCMSVCSRKQAGGFAKVTSGGHTMFADIDLAVMLQITVAVIKENLENFFNALVAQM